MNGLGFRAYVETEVAVLLAVCALFGAGHSEAADANPVVDRLRNEAPEAWRTLTKSHTHVAGAAVFRGNSISPVSTTASERSLEFLLKGEASRIISQRVKETGGPVEEPEHLKGVLKTAAAVNPQYGFLITYREEPKAWVIQGIGKDGRAKDTCRVKSQQDWFPYAKASWSVGGASFDELVLHPGFTLVSAKEVDREARNLVQVEFTFTPSQSELEKRDIFRQIWTLRGGTLMFWPEEHWALVESKLNFLVPPDKESKTITKVEYADPIEGRRPLKSVHRLTDAHWGTADESIVFEKYEFRDVQDREFTLSAFGLPEPGVEDNPRMFFWVVVSVVFAALILVIVALRLRRPTGARSIMP